MKTVMSKPNVKWERARMIAIPCIMKIKAIAVEVINFV
jgi:hypothetical protein